MSSIGKVNMSSQSQPAQVCVKQEPDWDEETSGGERPESAQHVQVKEEVVEYLKEEAEWEEAEWEDSAALYGVSEAPALLDLYAAHEVKEELVLGPESLQPADIVFTLYAAQALNVKEQRVPRDCVVRLERVDRLEALLQSQIHSNTNIATDRDTYVCDVCEKRFALKTQLMEHALIHIRHSSGRKASRRGVADNKPSRGRGRHRDHTYAKTAGGNLKTAEHTAGQQKASVSRPVYSVANADVGRMPRVKHSKTAKITKETTPYKCSRCSYASNRKNLLLVHESKHREERPYKCSRCSYASARKSVLLVHERRHTGEKPYKCNQCSYASARKCDLVGHHRSRHTGEKPYKCNHCSFVTAFKSYALVHERTHTGEKPYKCNGCSYASAFRNSLIVHERTHSGEKPYNCNYCSYASACKSYLLVHKRIHTGEKPYKCNHCSFATAFKGNLLVHERDTHRRETI